MSRPTAAVINRYQKKTYRRIVIDVKIAKADKFRELLAQNGDTVSAILGAAITDYIATHEAKPDNSSEHTTSAP